MIRLLDVVLGVILFLRGDPAVESLTTMLFSLGDCWLFPLKDVLIRIWEGRTKRKQLP